MNNTERRATAPAETAFNRVTRSAEARNEEISRFMHRLFDGISGERNYIRVSYYSHSGFAFNAGHDDFAKMDPNTGNRIDGNQLDRRLMFDDVDNAIQFIQRNKDQDMYVASTTFLSSTNAKKTNVSQRKWIVAEFDAKVEGDIFEILPFAPTLVVRSSVAIEAAKDEDGNSLKTIPPYGERTYTYDKLHLYWELDQSYTDADDLERINQINNDFVDSIPELDCVKDASRILRVPGTLHCKNRDEFFEVTWLQDNTENVYTLDQWSAAYPASASKKASKKTTALRSPEQKVTSGTMSRSVEGVLDDVRVRLARGEQCHETILFAQMRLLSLGDAGHEGVQEGLDVAQDLISAEMARRGERSWSDVEWKQALEGAMEKAAADSVMLQVQQHQVIFSSPNEPYEVAKQISRSLLDEAGNKTLIMRGDNWYMYMGSYWALVTEDSVRRVAYRALEDALFVHLNNEGEIEVKKWSPTAGKIANVVDAMKETQFVGSEDAEQETKVDVWIGKGPGDHVAHLIPMRNGLLDIRKRNGQRTLYPHSAGFFNLSVIDTDYDPTATHCPNWERLLHFQWNPATHSDQINAVEEFMGYTFAGDSDLETALIMVGPAGSGKGTMTNLLKHMLGPKASVTKSLETLGESFALESAIGKKLIIFPDSSAGRITNAGTLERIKMITGGDDLDVNRKGKTMWNGPLGGVMITANEIPTFKDNSGAISKRFLVLQMTKGVRGTSQMDPNLKKDILNESSAVLNRILDAYDRLRERGHFVQPDTSKHIVSAMNERASTLTNFVDEYCVIDEAAWVTKEEFYRMYSIYCEDQGVPVPSQKSVGSQIHEAAQHQIHGEGKKSVDGKRKNAYLGIGLKIVPVPKFAATNSDDVDSRMAASHVATHSFVPSTDTSTVADAPEVVKPQMDDTDNVVANEFNWNLAREGKTLRWLPVDGSWTDLSDDSEFIPMNRDNGRITVLDVELYGDIKDDEEFIAALNRN